MLQAIATNILKVVSEQIWTNHYLQNLANCISNIWGQMTSCDSFIFKKCHIFGFRISWVNYTIHKDVIMIIMISKISNCCKHLPEIKFSNVSFHCGCNSHYWRWGWGEGGIFLSQTINPKLTFLKPSFLKCFFLIFKWVKMNILYSDTMF